MTHTQRSRPAEANHEAAESDNGGADKVSLSLASPLRSVPKGYVLGIDGKRYPSRWMGRPERLGLIALVHDLHHEHGLSVRQIKGTISDQHGLTRSVGSISAYLNEWQCWRCSGDEVAAPEQVGGAA